jgi:hypothetical protein
LIRLLPRRLACSFIVALIAGCSSLPLLQGEIHYSYAELGARLGTRFPLEKSVAGLLEVKLSNPRLAMREEVATATAGTERRLAASFDMQARVTLTGKTMFGMVAISGLPRYDLERHALFLGNARVDTLRTDNMPDGLSAALGMAASAIARETLEDKPLYAFKVEDLQRLGLTLAPQRIELRPDGIALILR